MISGTHLAGSQDCLCIRCCNERPGYNESLIGAWVFGVCYGDRMPKVRYACEVCGNKRCPHHEDHRFECTGSNEPGQTGRLKVEIDQTKLMAAAEPLRKAAAEEERLTTEVNELERLLMVAHVNRGKALLAIEKEQAAIRLILIPPAGEE